MSEFIEHVEHGPDGPKLIRQRVDDEGYVAPIPQNVAYERRVARWMDAPGGSACPGEVNWD